MSLIILCPACARANEIESLHSRACSVCGAEFPEALREKAAIALRAPRRNRPRLLGFGMAVTAFGALVGAVVLPTALLTEGGSYEINGRAVTREVFLAQAGPFFVLAFVACGAIAWVLWTERHWGRELILACATAVSLGMVSAFALDPATRSQWPAAVFAGLVYIGLPAWYLYGRRSVRDYYRSLRVRATLSGDGTT